MVAPLGKGTALHLPLCAAARAGVKGVHFALSHLCLFRLSGAWMNREREKEPLLRTGSAEMPGLYRAEEGMLALHTQAGLASLGLTVELLS